MLFFLPPAYIFGQVFLCFDIILSSTIWLLKVIFRSFYFLHTSWNVLQFYKQNIIKPPAGSNQHSWAPSALINGTNPVKVNSTARPSLSHGFGHTRTSVHSCCVLVLSQINTHKWNRDLQKAAPTRRPRAPSVDPPPPWAHGSTCPPPWDWTRTAASCEE